MKIQLATMSSHETILLFSKPKMGKTYAYCSAIEACLEHGGQVFLINTDNGAKRTMQDYFGDKFEETANKINYYLVTSIEEVQPVIDDIKKMVKPQDLIVIDLFSSFWSMAQDKWIESMSKGNIADYFVRASQDKSFFGAFDSQKWIWIKRLDTHIINQLIVTPPCKVIAVCAQKDIEFDKMHHNKEVTDRYELVSGKPAGQPELSFFASTIIHIGEMKEQKYFVVLGYRGRSQPMYRRVNYGKNFWQAYTEWQKGAK